VLVILIVWITVTKRLHIPITGLADNLAAFVAAPFSVVFIPLTYGGDFYKRTAFSAFADNSLVHIDRAHDVYPE
jgi:hypothetical protein